MRHLPIPSTQSSILSLVLSTACAVSACTASNPDLRPAARAGDATVEPLGGDPTGGAGGQTGGAANGGEGEGGASTGGASTGGAAPGGAVGGSEPRADAGPAGGRADAAVPVDSDGDGIVDGDDNCPDRANLDQVDTDSDGVGDVCDECPRGGEDRDLDGDGVRSCDGDCDDTDPRNSPQQRELCDGVDNNCDSVIDEGYTRIGEPCAVGRGACERAGFIQCAPNGDGVACDAVARDPVGEACNGADDDCDGATDEDVLNCCSPGATIPCGSDVGLCEAGVQRCGGDRAYGECNAVAPRDEACNGADEDCDGLTDEGLLNACGRCGAVPNEVCNGVDDDCDGQVDDGVLNACGACGALPAEVCNRLDEDCDGRADEGVLNACGGCGAVPPEVCNGLDDNCDGQTDEGLLNACGGCGATPLEVCNGADDDCDGQVDDGVLNACGRCGAVPPEVCNGVDDDCNGRIDDAAGCVPSEGCNGADDDGDGQVDEGLREVCVVFLTHSGVGSPSRRMGDALIAVPDLNADGVPDVVVGAPALPAQGQGVFAFDGQTGARLWVVEGSGKLGFSLASGSFIPGAGPIIAAGAPEGAGIEGTNGLGFVALYDAAGNEVYRVSAAGGRHFGLAVDRARAFGRPDVDDLVFGDPDFDTEGRVNAGRITAYEVTDRGELARYLEQFGNAANRRFGERVYALSSFGGGASIAGTYQQDGDRRLGFLNANGQYAGAISAPAATVNTFGQAVVEGAFTGAATTLAVGAWGASLNNIAGSGAVFGFAGDGSAAFSRGSGVENGASGTSAATLPRDGGRVSLLVVGSLRTQSVEIVEATTGAVTRVAPPEGTAAEGYGRVVAVSTALANGTRRLFVSAPGFNSQRGRVWIYSVR